MNALNNVRMGPKLIASFLAVAVIIVIVAVVGYTQMNTINQNITFMYNDRLLPVEQLGQMSTGFYTLRGDLYKYALLPEERANTKEHGCRHQAVRRTDT
jgi:methyl-accepting chemotaxis protein